MAQNVIIKNRPFRRSRDCNPKMVYNCQRSRHAIIGNMSPTIYTTKMKFLCSFAFYRVTLKSLKKQIINFLCLSSKNRLSPNVFKTEMLDALAFLQQAS
ncbi:hypothetical protein KUTeg_002426 [Tegillarca granosa]|uniref:Uncharacterized protein n=1 Tax=Tegillarca granosa TaxID=220873 RepID=A0ABQ9FU94_TEGGR|nr:hypothetical protein KUTeg_002426 [Tegillarca granosa]